MLLFAKALTDLDRSQEVTSKVLDCDDVVNIWPYGNSLVNYMKMVS